MKLTIAVLLVTTTIGLGHMVLADGLDPCMSTGASPENSTALGADLTLIDEDEDEDEGSGWRWSGLEDDCGDDDDGGDGCTAKAAGDSAKAGIAAPPKNGLFTDGTAPTVKPN